MQLDTLPGAIRAVLGGMKDPGVPGFRVHHVGVAINNTDPSNPTPALARSATFALVDYEKTKAPKLGLEQDQSSALMIAPDIDYGFEVEFLRALFTNSELRSFSCQLNLTINSLFETGVNQDTGSSAPSAREALDENADGDTSADDTANTITIMGSYQANSTSGDDSNSGEGPLFFRRTGHVRL